MTDGLSRCDTCKHLEYKEGAFTCAIGVQPKEIMPGSWNFEDDCPKWVFVYAWI